MTAGPQVLTNALLVSRATAPRIAASFLCSLINSGSVVGSFAEVPFKAANVQASTGATLQIVFAHHVMPTQSALTAPNSVALRLLKSGILSKLNGFPSSSIADQAASLARIRILAAF